MSPEEEIQFLWYESCVTNACRYLPRSLGWCFWWSLRFELYDPDRIRLWAKKPEEALNQWIAYFRFKTEQLSFALELRKRGLAK